MGRWGLVVLLFISVVFTLNAATEPAETSTDNQPQIILLEGKLNKIRFETSRAEFFSPSGSITLKYDYIARIIKKKNKSGAKTRAEKTNDKTEKVQTVKLNGVLTQAEISQNAIEFYSADGSIKISLGFLLKSITKKSLSPKNLAKMFTESKELYCFIKQSNGNRLKAWKKKYYSSPKPGDLYKKLVATPEYIFVQDERKTIYKITRGCEKNHTNQYIPVSAYIRNTENDLILKKKQVKQYKTENKQAKTDLEDFEEKYEQWKRQLIYRHNYDKNFKRKANYKNPYSSDIKKLKQRIKSNEKKIENLNNEISEIDTLVTKLKSTQPW